MLLLGFRLFGVLAEGIVLLDLVLTPLSLAGELVFLVVGATLLLPEL